VAEALPVDVLHQHGVSPDPMGADYDYAKRSAGSITRH
jgi:catalase-peroxidase